MMKGDKRQKVAAYCEKIEVAKFDQKYEQLQLWVQVIFCKFCPSSIYKHIFNYEINFQILVGLANPAQSLTAADERTTAKQSHRR